MKLYNLIIRYRLWLGCLALLLAIVVNIMSSFWPSFVLYFIAAIAIISHFLIGPLRLVQEPMEKGDIAGVQKILESIWFPNLLIKPLRSTYHTLKGNLAMMDKNFDEAEAHFKESSKLGAPMPEAESSNKLQLGMMCLQKGNFREAEANIRAAIRAGFTDKESEAVADLSMCQIFMNKRQFHAARDFHRKAKACKPKTKEVKDQIRQIEIYFSRMPS